MDMWSLGCIMAELLAFTDKYRAERLHKRILFKGNSCFPMSPIPGHTSKKEKAIVVDKNDQMITILNVLGPQDLDSLDFLEDNQKQYLKVLEDQITPRPLKFADSSKEVL
jgi:hypothetical protein